MRLQHNGQGKMNQPFCINSDMQTNQWIWSSIMSKKQIKIKKLNNSIVGHGISLRPHK